MKRVFTALLTLSLAIGASGSFFTPDVYAANKKSQEAATAVDLLDDNTSHNTKSTSKVQDTSNTGSTYKLKGITGSPDIVAGSAVVMDARTGEVIYAKQAEETRYPASITKIMTTLLAIENCNMDDIVTFSSEAVNGIEEGSSSAGINVGAELTVEDTLYALMLESANEAGAAIAEHISGSDEDFGKLMTKRAKELGCTGTQFKNPHGLPDEEHYTTAHDMGLILKQCIKYEEFRKIAGTTSHTVENDTLRDTLNLHNHAKILQESYPDYYYKYCKGAKTGFTHAALNTLVSYAEQEDGSQLLCVILKDQGADNSYYDSKKLYQWAFDQVKTIKPLQEFDLEDALSSDESLSETQLTTYKSLNPDFDSDYPILVKEKYDDSNISESFRLDEDTKTGRLGYIDVMDGEDKICSVEVTYNTSSDAAQYYLSDKGSEDDLKTAKVTNKNSLLRKMISYLIRIVIACLLVYVIMQLIRRWQLEKNRKQRIRQRQLRHQKEQSSSQTSAPRNTNVKRPSQTSSSSQTQRRRRHR